MAVSKLKALEDAVAVMRKLGVVSWDGILLGPEPSKAEKKAKEEPDDNKDRRAYYRDVLGRDVTDYELKRLP